MNDRNIMKTNHAKQKQTFTFNAPAALRVLLVGDFTQWQKNPIPLEKQPNGTWRATVPLETGTYRYRFLVDGEWCDDPNCTLRVPNPFGSRDALLTVAPPREVTKPILPAIPAISRTRGLAPVN
jgi:5'-AMP-activated protein kinase regulatory beta subunit